MTNVHHFAQVGADGTGDARTALATLWDDLYKTKFLACLSDIYTLDQYRVRRLKPVETQSLITSVITGGGIMGQALPTQECAILRQHAIPLGRRGTGHIKMPAIPIENAKDGRIDVSLAILIDIFGAVMTTDQTESGTGYKFRSGVYSLVDNILRKIVKTTSLGPIKTVYSRVINVGD